MFDGAGFGLSHEVHAGIALEHHGPIGVVVAQRGGDLEAADLLPLLNARTRLVQVSLISFYNGFRLDWQPFHDVVRQYAPNALIAVDVTQALGRVLLVSSIARNRCIAIDPKTFIGNRMLVEEITMGLIDLKAD